MSKTDFHARVLADSITFLNARLTTLEVTFPRIVLAEFNTHRTFSRNSASSRAIPVQKRLLSVTDAPFIPIFGANQKGMQAGAELADQEAAQKIWLEARDAAVEAARKLSELGAHKQWANRLIEPFAWHTVIVTATEWDNFFALRCHEAAQPEIRTAAEAMWDAMKASSPRYLNLGEWHLPLVDERDEDLSIAEKIKVSVARCARVSYETHDGHRDTSADLALYDRLVTHGHMSPLEHPATPIAKFEWVGNFRGWKQHRKFVPGEDVFGSHRGSKYE